jgi:D-alanyl-D-alanine dipeptidase
VTAPPAAGRSTDDAARRAYWTRRNEEAWDFMFNRVLPYPVEECDELLVMLPDAIRGTGAEVVFSERPHVLGLARIPALRAGQIDAFVTAARAFNARGWMIRVEDGYRTRAIQKQLGREPLVFDAILARSIWELGGKVPSPAFMFRRCSGLVATVPKFATHMSGSAIDVSVVLRDAPDREVDRGAPYVELSALTPMDSPFVCASARAHRAEISALFDAHGFVAYPYEFWHYSSGDAYEAVLRRTGRPARYGPIDRDPVSGAITPIADSDVPLNSEDEIRAEITLALRRLAEGSRGG